MRIDINKNTPSILNREVFILKMNFHRIKVLVVLLLLCLPFQFQSVALTPEVKRPRLFGMDYLGGGKYPQVIIDSHPRGWAAGFFTQKDLFDDPTNVIKHLARRGRTPAIRLNLAWRDDHNFTRNDFPKIIAEAKRFAEFPKRYKNVIWYFSGATEHVLNKELAKELADEVLKVLPKRDNCFYVNNPWVPFGSFITGDRIVNEVHGSKASPRRGAYLFSHDGSSSVDDDVQTRKESLKGAEIFFLWHPAMNGRLKVTDETPRPQRRSWPTKSLIESIKYLRNDSGKGISLPTNWLWKSHSDRHYTPPEPRAYKPVLIAPVRLKYFELVTKSGKVIARSSSPLAFVDGRWRYYFNQFGYKLSQEAIKDQNTGVCKLRGSDGKIYGKVNPAFRHGTFR